MISSRQRRSLRKLGWAYVAYHAVTAVLFVASAIFDVDPESWRKWEFQLDLLVVFLLYPATIPAFIVCGGLHDYCTTMLGRTMQWAVLGMMIVWYVMGWWVLASVVVRRFRSPDSSSDRHA